MGCRVRESWGRGRGETGADGFAPSLGAEGIAIFVLGDLDGFDQGLTKGSESCGGFGLDLALGDGRDDAAQGGGKIAGGDVIA